MNPGILEGIAAGIGLGFLNFVLALLTMRIAARTRTVQRAIATTVSSMLIRIGILLLILYFITKYSSVNFMAVVLSFVAAYIVFMIIEVYYLIRMGRSKVKGKD